MSDLEMTPPASRTVTAFFDHETDAKTAYNSLLHAGFSDADIHLTPGRQDSDAETDLERPEHKGFFSALGRFFMGEDDRHLYAEGLDRGGYLIVVDNLDATLHDKAIDILDGEGAVDIDERAEQWRTSGWTGGEYASPPATPAAPAATGASAATVAAGSAEPIPVVEEQLLVGKRDVNLGRVRVRSYLQETPVSEQVSLRDERVTLDRRPIDRPVTEADGDAFAPRSIEAEEHTEQAVVSKQARVVEEVSLQKEAVDREETISDTVRHTEIDVDDDRGTASSGTSTTPPKP